jgi:hypothetical protein
MVTGQLPNEVDLISDLRATFPDIHVRPLREYGGFWKDSHGAWVGGEACMPDGLRIFDHLADAEFGYDGGVHEGFTKWIEDRGWYLECEDYGIYVAVSILATQRQFGMTQEECDVVATRSVQAMRDQYHLESVSGNGFAGELGRLRPVLIPVPDSEVPF